MYESTFKGKVTGVKASHDKTDIPFLFLLQSVAIDIVIYVRVRIYLYRSIDHL